ncbi:ribonuclease M5 [Clostridium sartagoforme]|uniref:Ribonuclease M5 n=1 Tax=Clostridium sartagoforme TaxID=84031 RepID=A0A4S2DE66_9CLOT|nr:MULTISPECIES: ribonuclease M5 [Clostridium]MBS4803830.1 ribonuclease M5 [Clostridium sp.]MBS5939864.1 ribonuclease M5 [Clostridium sp.]MBS5949991.1 ribonuclease M5 [Clostridium sp.]MDU5109782.1 ribonuclease M5 [Clostridium sp.]TGY40249.1 ribonuclease M5 [Clostridium sartagoforme]
MIKEVIVVEGRDDITAVKQAVDAEVIAVGGFGINAKVIDRIRDAQRRKGVIVLTDPDFAGEKIRSIISKRVKGIKHAYIAQEDGIKGDDIGVENATPEVIIEALNRAKVSEEVIEEIYKSEDMFYFKLTGDINSKSRRLMLGKELGIGYGNANQMLTRLNKYSISKEEFITAIEKIERKLGVEK